MAVSRRRCTSCREYFQPTELRVTGLSGVCSDECMQALIEKSRAKHARREKVRQAKREGKPRLGGGIRNRIRQRDNGLCRWCLAKPARGEIHHVLYRSQGGKDSSHNLILLCDEHHREAHSNKRLWQPVLLAYIWLYYAEGQQLPIPEILRYLVRTKQHPHMEAAKTALRELRPKRTNVRAKQLVDARESGGDELGSD